MKSEISSNMDFYTCVIALGGDDSESVTVVWMFVVNVFKDKLY
jgi:hypothetical protein